jgi:hypothetical protein
MVDETGARSRRQSSNTLEDDLEFDRWDRIACEHEWGVLLHHRIGHIANVALLRQVLANQPQESFPIILSKVIYNGTHCGDFIGVDQLILLKPELKAVASVRCDDALADELIRNFEKQLGQLVETGCRVRKPIAF